MGWHSFDNRGNFTTHLSSKEYEELLKDILKIIAFVLSCMVVGLAAYLIAGELKLPSAWMRAMSLVSVLCYIPVHMKYRVFIQNAWLALVFLIIASLIGTSAYKWVLYG